VSSSITIHVGHERVRAGSGIRQVIARALVAPGMPIERPWHMEPPPPSCSSAGEHDITYRYIASMRASFSVFSA
jgi:hypothetical protein